MLVPTLKSTETGSFACEKNRPVIAAPNRLMSDLCVHLAANSAVLFRTSLIDVSVFHFLFRR